MVFGKWGIGERSGRRTRLRKKPAPIVEAVTGICRNWQDESTYVVLGLRCEGMSKTGFFSCGAAQYTPVLWIRIHRTAISGRQTIKKERLRKLHFQRDHELCHL